MPAVRWCDTECVRFQVCVTVSWDPFVLVVWNKPANLTPHIIAHAGDMGAN